IAVDAPSVNVLGHDEEAPVASVPDLELRPQVRIHSLRAALRAPRAFRIGDQMALAFGAIDDQPDRPILPSGEIGDVPAIVAQAGKRRIGMAPELPAVRVLDGWPRPAVRLVVQHAGGGPVPPVAGEDDRALTDEGAAEPRAVG